METRDQKLKSLKLETEFVVLTVLVLCLNVLFISCETKAIKNINQNNLKLEREEMLRETPTITFNTLWV